MTDIKTGVDLFKVVDGTTSIDLRPLFSGSEIVRSDGVALDRIRFGDATTGLERLTSLPSGQSGVVQIEWILEHSISILPIDREPFGLGEGKADFHTLINRGGLVDHLPTTDGLVTQSLGSMGIHRGNGDTGGSFELLVNINPLIVISTVGGDIKDLEGPDVLQVIDGTGLLNPVSSINGQWSHRSFSEKHRPETAKSTNSFFAASNPDTGYPSFANLVSGSAAAVRAVTAPTFD